MEFLPQNILDIEHTTVVEEEEPHTPVNKSKKKKGKKTKPLKDGRGRPQTSPTTLAIIRIEKKVDKILAFLENTP